MAWIINKKDPFGLKKMGVDIQKGISSWWRGLTGQGTDTWQKEYEFQMKQYEEEKEKAERWRQEELEWQSPAFKAEQLKAAGLHPSLAVGGGSGGGGTPVNISSGSGPGTQQQTMNPIEMARLASQVELDRAQKMLIEAEADKTRAEIEGIGWDTTWKAESFDARMKELGLGNAAKSLSNEEKRVLIKGAELDNERDVAEFDMEKWRNALEKQLKIPAGVDPLSPEGLFYIQKNQPKDLVYFGGAKTYEEAKKWIALIRSGNNSHAGSYVKESKNKGGRN